MTSTPTAALLTVRTTDRARTARVAQLRFLGSFAGFVGIVITSAAIDTGRDSAQREAADELGVNLNHLPQMCSPRS